MSQKKKLLKKFLERPAALSFSEIQVLLFSLGFKQETVRGSHYKFINPNLKKFFVIPIHHGDCKVRYKVNIQKFILLNNLHNFYLL